MSKPQKKISLSASKIKTLHNCSFVYYCQYVLKIPQKTNLGASRGLCAHTVLECLVNPRHRKTYEKLIKDQIPKSIKRLVEKHARKLNVENEEDFKMIYDMIIIAAKFDFFCDGSERVIAEEEFRIESENYLINGFIDKTSFSPDEIKIIDYKSSKIKFNKEEIEGNLQGLMYSLACFKKYKKIPKVQFLFLRFPRNPVQFFEQCSEAQLEGFEMYLDHIARYLSKFDYKQALKDMAVNSKEKYWLCGKEGLNKAGEVAFICQYRRPCDYYVIKNSDGEIVKTSFDSSELHPKEGEKLEKKHHKGCPAFIKS